MKKCIIFDFDGTLVQSDQIKRRTFFEIVKGIQSADAILEELLAKFPTSPRDIIFSLLYKQLKKIGSSAIDNRSKDKWVSDYTDMCERFVVQCPEVKGMTAVLDDLMVRKISVFINSATPEKALISICKRRGIDHYFCDILGAPRQKTENIRFILQEYPVEASDILVIGNGESDRAAAYEHAIDFVAIGDEPQGDGIVGRINDLTTLAQYYQ